MTKSLFAEFDSSNYEQWRTSVEKELKGNDYTKTLLIEVEEGIVVEPLYTSETRSSHSSSLVIRKKPTCCNEQIISLVDGIPAANKKALHVLNAGISALTFSGTIASYADFKSLMKEIGIQYIQLGFVNCSNYPQLVEFLIDYATEQKIDPSSLNGYFAIDPIGDLLQTGSWKKDEVSDFSVLIDVAKRCSEKLPQFRSCIVPAELFHNAGAAFSEEIALGSAIGIEYIDRLTNAGLSLERAIKRLQINVACGPELLHEIAKLRSMKMVWNRILHSYSETIKSSDLYFSAETSTLYSSAFDPHTNLLRASTSVYAMMCANMDSIHVLPFNEMQTENDNEFAERIARNIFLVLRDEAWIDKTVDPAAGSYFIEELGQQLIKKSYLLLQDIEEQKGILALFSSGKMKAAIDRQFERKYLALQAGNLVMVGANKYKNPLAKTLNAEEMQQSELAITRKRLTSVLTSENGGGKV